MAARRVLAARHVAAERRRAAALDGAHRLQLIEARVAAVGLAPGGPCSRKMSASSRTGRTMADGRYHAGSFPASRIACLWRGVARRASGLSTLAMRPVATRV